jgi:hypothetical protein
MVIGLNPRPKVGLLHFGTAHKWREGDPEIIFR